MSDTLMVIVGCDCDPDRPRYGGTRYDDRTSLPRWRGLTEGIDILRECLRDVENASGLKPKIAFCLRSDTQMKDLYGTASWSLEEFGDTWRELKEEGHELAWHPHLWRWSDEKACWIQEIHDSQWIVACLEVGFSEFSRTLGEEPVTCHMGWTYHSNTTMKKVSELGLKVDFSASPGVFYEGGPGDDGTTYDNMIDWRGTPLRWYHPSEADYRRPVRGNEKELAIVEIPKFTSRSALLKKAKELGTRTRPVSGGKRGTSVLFQVTILPALFNRFTKERLKSKEADPFFATYFHPDELLADKPRSARGAVYSRENLKKNLLTIIRAARKKGRDVTFATGADAFRYIQEKVGDYGEGADSRESGYDGVTGP